MIDFKTKVNKYGGYGFTGSQEIALDLLTDWANNSNKLSFTLMGAGGVGKTYIIKYFLDHIFKQNACVSAPTHKAVRTIENRTNRKGKTLQALHGLRPNVNLDTFDLDKIQFDSLGNVYLQNYKLVVIDECSMINKSLFLLNERRAKDYKVKILYVGDWAQIPPIGERISLAFSVKDQYELTEIVRQDLDNPLIPMLDCLRNDIKTDGNTFLTYLKKNPKCINDKGEGYEVVDLKTFHRNAIETFKSEAFSKDTDYARIAAWKNDTVIYHNKIIRNVLAHFYANGDTAYDPNFKMPAIDINDLLIGYKTILDEYNTPMLINSEDYIVQHIIPRMSDNGYATYSVQIVQRNNPINVITLNIVNHLDPTFIHFYEKLKTLYYKAIYAHRSAKGSAWKTYFEFKDRNLCLVNFPILEGESIKTTVTKDIDYGFSLTTHKLQGSTIENMFINVKDMIYTTSGNLLTKYSYPYAIETRNKLIYTAISRTSKFAYIHI